MIRLLFFVAIGIIFFLVVRRLMKPSQFIRCGRCEGKGYWYAARGKETCDWCKGSGKLPGDMAQ